MNNVNLKEKCLEVFDEYINQLEIVISETTVMGSFLECDLVLYCVDNEYNFAFNKNFNISESMEKALSEKYRKGFVINKENKSFELRESYGPHSEFKMYYFHEK